ncbi:MAG: DUF4876 domain-containing protein [Sphingobacterium sp.]|jgi:hypothetical protein|nr:DUF4876 domain-containing protein [Sphingobacterium sp.]
MKKIYLLILSALVLVLGSCRKDFEPVTTVQLTLQLEFPDSFVDGSVPKGVEVMLRNNITGELLKTKTDDQGKVVSTVIPGTYTVTASKAYSPEETSELLGSEVEMFVNGNLSPVIVNEEKTVSLKLKSSRAGGLVIREFYYSAVTSYLYDGFTEIYNNSNEPIRIDSLYIGSTRAGATNNTSATGPYNFLTAYPEEVYLNQVFMVPSTGQPRFLEPGKSLVIAISGLNHKSDPNGNKNSPVDLGDADFEVFWDYPTGRDIDYPEVPNMIHAFAGSTAGFDWNIGINGAGMVIFNTKDFDKLPVRFEPDAKTAGTTQYIGIPVSDIIDGVDATANATILLSNKRLPVSVDASMTTAEVPLKGRSVRRKVKTVINGRTIFVDTNNSSADFEVNLTPSPRKWN